MATSAGTSWIIVDERGGALYGPYSVQPLAIPKESRLSVRDTIHRYIQPFTMKKGTATGILSHVESSEGGYTYSVITVVGSSLKDVIVLREKMLEVAGVKKLNYFFPELPDLKNIWQRVRWLIQWLVKGQS